MKIDSASLRQHYAMLSDEALAEIDPDELVHDARALYEEERSTRRSAAHAAPSALSNTADYYATPSWLETAALATSFSNYPGQNHSPEAAQACDVLHAAGIPAVISVDDNPAGVELDPYKDFKVLVPGPLSLKATAVLDKEIFNAREEGAWKAHVTALTDEELLALPPDKICAGLTDRIERLTRVVHEELASRGLKE